MVRSAGIFIIALSTLLLVGASQKEPAKDKILANCNGYTVIEVDKGIDCQGDTIQLMKVNGYFERVR